MDILSIRDTTGPGLVCFFEDTPQEHDKNTINSFNFWVDDEKIIRTTTTSQDTLFQDWKHLLRLSIEKKIISFYSLDPKTSKTLVLNTRNKTLEPVNSLWFNILFYLV